MDYKNKNALIIGAGISGVAAYDLLLRAGANPILYDSNSNLNTNDVRNKTCEKEQANVIIGEFPEAIKSSLDLVVLSPGVPTDTGLALELRERGLYITGEIELAYSVAKGRLIAITGTNGKTTTTALVGKIAADYLNSFKEKSGVGTGAGTGVPNKTHGTTYVVGNIGIPYTSVALATNEEDITVAEISSFQLETIHEFHPNVSAILNITPDHLNRHHTMENYIQAKEDITLNQTAADTCVLNYEDEVLRAFGEKISGKKTVEENDDDPTTVGGMKCRVKFFSSERAVKNGCFYRDEYIYIARDGVEEKLMNIHDMHLLGMHNVENVMAAICMADAMNIPMNIILESVKDFRAVEHRIEFVENVKGVDYYNDSKGTNPDAAIKAVLAMNRPTVLIGGGYDKESTYDEWIESFGTKVKALVLLGQTADKIEACARAHGFTNIYRVESLEEAVEKCASLAEDGDAVLLSPACASWGMFPNYEVRGTMFKELVRSLPK
ncbi:MAG: UDP-N-acetylmuramoyl-L-alanine--D-glutamate ligase [Lachnospiraceae bacterium]|nr:UDP-N-acetylmuramoyl-L-alanine--D-glutamate ligase [Lachnospiraceae bacterium]